MPSLTAYEEIENSRAHIYNEIIIFAEKYEIIKILILNYQIIKLVSNLSQISQYVNS